jgi:hypothetical protein
MFDVRYLTFDVKEGATKNISMPPAAVCDTMVELHVAEGKL